MERLSEIVLLEYGRFSIDLFQLTMIALMAAGLLFVYWLLEHRLFPWYYGMDSTSEKNRNRMRRVSRLTLLSVFIVWLLRTLDIDFSLINVLIQELDAAEAKRLEMENPDGANDGFGLRFIVKISTLVEVLVAYVVANLLDVILGEVVNQRFHRLTSVAKQKGRMTTSMAGGTQDRIKWLRPFLYTLVVIFFANLTGLARYELTPHVPFDSAAAGLTITVGKVLNAVLVFFLISLLLSFFISFLLRGYYQRTKIDTGSQFAINRLLTYFVYLIGILLVIQTAGFNLVGIWTGAAALLVGIGIGLQQTFNDLICGVIILFERSVKVGDVIELSGHEVGTVRKIGTRTSVVETRDDIIIFVPNSKLIGENVMNWSQVERKARFHVQVGVAYGSDTALVKELLITAAKEHPRTMDSPPPFVRFLEFGESSLNFDVIFWSRDLMRIEDTKSDIRFAIDAAFQARGIEIPFPRRDIWIRGENSGEEKE